MLKLNVSSGGRVTGQLELPMPLDEMKRQLDTIRTQYQVKGALGVHTADCAVPSISWHLGHTILGSDSTLQKLNQLRCNPTEGDYQAYLSCFDKQAQRMGLTETGKQALRDAADPALPHTYSWYVIENINAPELRSDHELPLEEAMRLYAGLDCGDKRLGVTKDGIDAVDLAIHWDGREWLSGDRLKLDSFKDDPVVADAADKLQQMLDEAPAVGRVTFASGERWSFTDPQKYLQAVREELPCQATTGFRCETLTDDPTVRKAVDDMICDLYGEENPRQLEDYGGIGMTMGG